jgi:hypothetical protein
VRVEKLGLVGCLRGKVLVSKINKVRFHLILWLRLRLMMRMRLLR